MNTIRAMRGPGTTVVDGRNFAFVPGLTRFAVDSVAADADALIDLPIQMTIVDGRIVHEAR